MGVAVPEMASRGHWLYTSGERQSRAGATAALLGTRGGGTRSPDFHRSGSGSGATESGQPWRKGAVCPIPILPDLSIPIVDPKRDCGGIEQQQKLVLKHLLLQAFDGPALPFAGFLQGTEGTGGSPCTRTPLATP